MTERITDMSKLRELLSASREWTIKRAVWDWEERGFVVGKEDIDGIIGDLEKEYFYKSQVPYAELHEDGNISIVYPTCVLASHGQKKPIQIVAGKQYRVKDAPMEFIQFFRYLMGKIVTVTSDVPEHGKYSISYDFEVPYGSQHAQRIRGDLLEEIN